MGKCHVDYAYSCMIHGVPKKAGRPAHRPSRRSEVVDACMMLMASRHPDEVTVADIAAAADMTSAAIYYHFPSKDEILREGMDAFASALTNEVTRAVDSSVSSGESVGEVIAGLVQWMDNWRLSATVYFAMSSAQYSAVEVTRRRTRELLVSTFRSYLKLVRVDATDAQVAVMAVGLLSLMETSSTSWLRQDADWLNLGSRRFLTTVAEIADSLTQAVPAER
jgi:AcrR family transcriptional regulator